MIQQENEKKNDIMMTLSGEGIEGFQFSISTAAYQSFRRSSQYRWQEQSRLQTQAFQQFIGVGSETIDLDGIIYPHYMGGLGQINQMREIAKQGQALTLITMKFSEGENIGRWCIKEITENRTEFTTGGIPLKIEFSISMSAYGDRH